MITDAAHHALDRLGMRHDLHAVYRDCRQKRSLRGDAQLAGGHAAFSCALHSRGGGIERRSRWENA